MTLLSAELENPTGYGRVLRKERRAAPRCRRSSKRKRRAPAQKKIREINSGFYVFAVKELYATSDKLSTDNPHGEYYLTDMAEVLRKARQRVVAWKTANPSEVLGGNTRAELADIDQQMRLAKCRQLMADGVTIFYPATCVIDADVEIAPDTVIEPYVQLLGKTKIGAGLPRAVLLRDSRFRDWRRSDGPPGLHHGEARIGSGSDHRARIRICVPGARSAKARTWEISSRRRKSSWARDRRRIT